MSDETTYMPVAAHGNAPIEPEEVPEVPFDEAMKEFRAAAADAMKEGVFDQYPRGVHATGMKPDHFDRYCSAKMRFDRACLVLARAQESR